MNIIIKSALAIIVAVSFVLAQTSETRHYWIVLSKKENSSSKQFSPQSLGITERSLKRRGKALSPDRLIDDFDLPVSELAIAQIKQTGVKIRSVSRWLNAISVEASAQQLQSLKALPMVTATEPVALYKRSRPAPSSSVPLVSSLAKTSGTQGLNYGPSATQLTNMKVVDLHAVGVNGTGVLIGMLDDGFNNHRTHVALRNINIVAEYDFVYGDTNTSAESWEYVDPLYGIKQGDHGAGTLSLIGGYSEGNLIGAAYGVSFVLAKTEIDSVEIQADEDNYVEAMEWMERLGVDITSSSLGYDDLDPSGQQERGNGKYDFGDIVYKMKDGRTAITSIAATIAARKGVLVVTAMGNDYWGKRDTVSVLDTLTGITTIYWQQKGTKDIDTLETGSLSTPADADSIIAVGATTSDGEIATFSSTGPTFDGRMKPEVVTQGMAIYWANGTTTTGYSSVQGTSCATPLVAGAAALVLSAHPELSAMQVRQALLNTAVPSTFRIPGNTGYPNNYYGHGIVDAYAAALYYGPVFSNVPVVTAVDSQLAVSTFIVSNGGIQKDSVFLNFSVDGSAFNREHLQSTATPNEFKCNIPRFSNGVSIACYFTIKDTLGRSFRYPPENTVHRLDTLKNQNIKLLITYPEKYMLYQNYPNPFNNETILTFDVPNEENIEITVFNILGQNIKIIYSGRPQIGKKTVKWDGTNERGCRVGTGVYIARLKTSKAAFSKKMLYIK